MALEKDHAGEMIGAVDYRDFITKHNPMIVQIGAHDGVLGEEYGLQELLESVQQFRLVLVEPLSPYFDKLANVYGKYGNSVSYCKHAISDIDGETTMVEQGCMSHISPNGSIVIQSKTWNTFTRDMSIDTIDLLILDCEGYEFEILKSIDFSAIKPKVIRYEYKHISNKEECDEYLISQGYRIEYCKHDHTYNKIAIL
jgi:FkbM family methyltransferase